MALTKEKIIRLEAELWPACSEDSGILTKEELARMLVQTLGQDSPEEIIGTLKQVILLGRKDTWYGIAAASGVALANKISLPVPLLHEMLESKIEEMRACGVYTIRHLALYLYLRQRNLEQLQNFLEPFIWHLSDPVSRVRNPLIEAFGLAKCSYAVDPIISLLNDINSKHYAFEALGEIGDQRAADPILKFLKSEDVDIRASAIQALGMLGEIRALPELERIAKEDKARAWAGEISVITQRAIKAIKRKKINANNPFKL